MDREHHPLNDRLSTAVWSQRDPDAIELATIDCNKSGFRLSGDVAVGNNNNTKTIAYIIDVDTEWRTRSVVASVKGRAGPPRQIAMTVNDVHEWSIRSREHDPWERAPQFDGLIDVDLGCTPATNLLPIKRYALAIGESVEVTAVWITFPDLNIQMLPQSYTRLSECNYRYESVLTGFEAVLTVDDFGVVDRYGDIWVRLNTAR